MKPYHYFHSLVCGGSHALRYSSMLVKPATITGTDSRDLKLKSRPISVYFYLNRRETHWSIVRNPWPFKASFSIWRQSAPGYSYLFCMKTAESQTLDEWNTLTQTVHSKSHCHQISAPCVLHFIDIVFGCKSFCLVLLKLLNRDSSICSDSLSLTIQYNPLALWTW